MSLPHELERLHSLYASGAITAADYQRAKSKLLEDGNSPEGANDQPVPFDWKNVAEQPPAAEMPARTGKVTEKDMLKALQAGAVGGAILGMPLSFASGIPFWPAVIGAALAGAIAWTALSFGVKATARSRGFGAALLRLLCGAAIVVYGLALLFIVGCAIYVTSHRAQPINEPYIPPARVN